MRDALTTAVGGKDALAALDATPLPDEPFSWAGVPDGVHERVGEVLTLVDRCCGALLDVECRTACRRFLNTVAVAEPAVFGRRGKAATAAVALIWCVGQANALFGAPRSGGRLRVKDLAAHLGVSAGNLASRSEPMLRAVGFDPGRPGPIHLGSPRYLIAARRAEILALRDDLDVP